MVEMKSFKPILTPQSPKVALVDIRAPFVQSYEIKHNELKSLASRHHAINKMRAARIKQLKPLVPSPGMKSLKLEAVKIAK